MPKTTFKNISTGPRGVRTVDGSLIMLEVGQISNEIEVNDGEFQDASATGYFEVSGAAVEPGPLDGSVDELTTYLASIEDLDEIQALIDAETAGKSRKGAIAALEARRDELLGA